MAGPKTGFWKKLARSLRYNASDEIFLRRLGQMEGILSRVLSVAMVVVIVVTVVDLGLVLARSLFTPDRAGFFRTTLTEIFGLFLSVLIALEILENITAYIRKHVVQVELVIATALTAVGRKLIILDLEKVSGVSLIGLAIAIFALSISYWIVRTSHRNKNSQY
ncbi:MAG: phosphate-starvation-inducible PsiE family protein [Cyanobacteria bacterium P01_C01_bin.73]